MDNHQSSPLIPVVWVGGGGYKWLVHKDNNFARSQLKIFFLIYANKILPNQFSKILGHIFGQTQY